MIWFLVLHIGALLVWAAAILSLAVLAGSYSTLLSSVEEPAPNVDSTLRLIFTQLATPAALLAIIAGTLVFLLDNNLSPWLIIKLTLVVGLVLCHLLTGLMVLQAEKGENSSLRLKSLSLALAMSILMLCIVWIVLAKPSEEVLLWWR